MKVYQGLARDHSGSMANIARHAARDYNENIESIKEEAATHGIDTIVTVVELGWGNTNEVRTIVKNSSVSALQVIKESSYSAKGYGTPLFDAVGELVEQLQAVPDADDPTVSFVVFTTTDGGENASKKYTGADIARLIKKLQMTDRWTFVFRVPAGYKRHLTQYGIPEGNIQEWEQTERGIAASTVQTKSAFRGFYAAKARGINSTDKFFADLSTVTLKEVKANLVDISNQVDVFEVDARNDGVEIRDFVEAQGLTYTKGCAFYQLVKTEKVQGYKQIAIRVKATGEVYSGFAARQMLGLGNDDAKVAPDSDDYSKYEIYVQSTSFNRKLTQGTNLMVWVAVPV